MIWTDGIVKVWVEYVLNHFSHHTHNYLESKNDQREVHSCLLRSFEASTYKA